LGKAQSTKAAKLGARTLKPGKVSSYGPSQQAATDLAEVRRQITDLVRNGAIEMVETTIDQVGKGHYLGMKYLFEMIGLYPEVSANEAVWHDSLAATLLRRLGIPEIQMAEETVTKDSGSSAAAGEDGLE
jgi:hypothetical protein